ncbi:T9SS type A sorting domain-containing protein [Rufibacter psychrotolerans]|uniref:T9SS type A sorting domain-containing protein n=1 Tax=Rufibacter psychrotolerans TaxID=2812556 RepID=UPI0019677AED|nr:T9SS type A sorting domain-containing protein [Rufibacter sp. SYSU D00308]
MKRTILSWASTLLLIFLGFTYQAQAQCAGTKSDECFDFNFKGITRNSNGTVTLAFGVKVNCNRDLSHASFELPRGVKAISATGTSGYENGTNNPFYSIKFNVGSGYKNGKTANFSYTITAEDFSKMTSLRAEAKASTTVGMVSFDPKACGVTGGNTGGGNDNGNGNGNNGGGNGNNGNGNGNGGGNNGGGNGNGGGNNGNNCKDSQPRPIEGPANPCPGDEVEYSIRNEYTSYTWDVPRAQSGAPVVGWSIVSGQGTNRVRVKVGMKNGTMKVTVNHAVCGTKVATMPVKPGNEVAVSIDGSNSFCPGDVLVFKASASQGKGNGNGNGRKSSYDYLWTVPSGWTIVSGEKTNTLIVKAGNAAGQVSVAVASNAKKNKAVCEAGEATIAVNRKATCSPCAKPDLDVEAPAVVCASGDRIYKFGVDRPDPTGRVKYQFFLPEEFQIVSQGYGYVNIKVNDAKPDSTLFVTVVAVNGNNCGAEAVCLPVEVEDCPTGPCDRPVVALVAPDTVCNLAEEATTFRVANPEPGVTYVFDLPENFLVIDEGPDYVSIIAVLDESELGQPLTIRVTGSNECASVADEETVIVTECEPGNPLPVTLVRFNGASRNGAVELTWSTASEINNDRFEIERSLNGRDFLKVGQVKGHGNSSVLVDYAFTDRSAAAGTVYYRLKQVDTDNAFEYSKVIAVKHNASGASAAAVSVFPNPVTDGNVSIRFQELVQGNATIRLVDMNGRVLHSQELNSVGSEVPMNLRGLNLKAGVYMISITANGQSTTQRIMIR